MADVSQSHPFLYPDLFPQLLLQHLEKTVKAMGLFFLDILKYNVLTEMPKEIGERTTLKCLQALVHTKPKSFYSAGLFLHPTKVAKNAAALTKTGEFSSAIHIHQVLLSICQLFRSAKLEL